MSNKNMRCFQLEEKIMKDKKFNDGVFAYFQIKSYIDKDGNVGIDFQYDCCAACLSDGMSLVKKGGKWYILSIENWMEHGWDDDQAEGSEWAFSPRFIYNSTGS